MHSRTRSRLALPLPAALGVSLLGGFALLAAAPARALDPWVDTGFAAVTAVPDTDLVIVRERAFESLDLSSLGLGVQDYVQSIYFRLYAELPTVASFSGTVVFPEGVEILAFVTSAAALGGGEDDGVASETDASFGIGVDPDAYSSPVRGFEAAGGRGSSEFILSDTARSFAFGLNITVGVDDFRVIIDYGSSFPPDLSFDVGPYDVGELGGAIPRPGIRVGNPDGAVIGSGDFGEVGSLFGIPLTADVGPEPEASATQP
jgi:hypothetical protein